MSVEDGPVRARSDLATTSMATKLDLAHVLRLLLVADKQHALM
jgi:hypothetical protein